MEPFEEATKSLKRIQQFNPEKLVRTTDLGAAKNFEAAVEPAERLIELYTRLSLKALEDFPDSKLNEVRNQANSDFNLFEQVLEFDVDKTTADRDNLIQKVINAYAPTFEKLHPLIAYSLHRSADFQRLDSEARATIQSIEDQASELKGQLEETQRESEQILEEVRKTAAEAGVSQQAHFFKEAAEYHTDKAEQWRMATIWLVVATGVFAFLSLFIHKIPAIAPESAYDTVQIAVSKALIFAVLFFTLYLAAKNFLSHKHNYVVNRHRQEALQTYQALVDAAGDPAKSDIVITHAAACIFSPQATGYMGQSTSGSSPSAQTFIDLIGSKSTPE
ncbi:MAG: hypothetical protein GVY11_02215 [Gammaproteobacteria bacterium]|jgi:hypothetical protein|nr:hypothetical protein [Gammaproteobacteria bacterium]